MRATYSTILMPVDFSPQSVVALEHAISIADRFDSALVALHVISKEVEEGAIQRHTSTGPAPLFDLEATPRVVPADVSETVTINLREQAHAALEHFLEPYVHERPIELRIAVGHPYEQILATAEQETCDLIVMGTHGRTGLSHLIMGSVAERIVRLAPCPVLTVREAS